MPGSSRYTTGGHRPEGPRLVLLGPAASGKSTLGRLVARRVGCAFIDLDDIAAPYYAEAGWSLRRLAERAAQVGRVRAEREWEAARLHAVHRAVAAHPGTVLALGAGHGSYRHPAHRRRVARALAGVEHVIMLVPAADRDTALATLRARSLARKGTDWISDGHDFLAEWLDDPGTRSLATRVINTEGQAAEATAQCIARLLAA